MKFLDIMLQDLRCNWSLALHDEILENIDDYYETHSTTDAINHLKRVENETKQIKVQIESNF